MIYSIARNALPYLLLTLIVLFDIANAWGEDGLSPTANLDTPTFSNDGTRFVFSSDLTGNSTIWIANRDGSKAYPLVNWFGSNQIDPDWSADGKTIVFSSDRESNNYDIWTILADGTKAIRLTSNSGDNRHPRYSPDGRRILFTSNRTGKDELWYMSADGSSQKAIGLQSILINDPAWSPDGSKIVYAGCLRPPNGSAITDGVCNLYTITLDASVTKQITFGKVNDWSPDWWVFGIVFSSSRNGGQSLWMVDETGSNLKQVTDGNDGLNLDPKWDKSSNTIVFSKVGEIPNIWSTDTFGNQTQLTSLHGRNSKGVVVNDGSDVNSDGNVNCDDITVVKNSFGKRSVQTGYDLRADINRDTIVDVKDLSFVAKRIPKEANCKN